MPNHDHLPDLPLAHPVTGHPHVDVPVVLVASTVALGVLLLVLLVPTGPADAKGAPRRDSPRRVVSWEGSLSWPRVVTRAMAVVLLVTAVVAGRFGSPDELENLAPALVVGAGWPLLVVACLLVPAWRWVDPWDTTVRVLTPGDRSEPAAHVWPAVALATAWLWLVAVYQRPLDPRAVGVALLAHTTVTLAGCLVTGRRRWLSSAEPIGVGLTLLTTAARGRLAAAAVPRGAGALVGVTIGGLLFAALRRTELWSGVAVRPGATLYATAAFVACCALGAALVALGAFVGARSHDAGAVVRGLLPATAGLVLAVALARNRLSNSVELLPGLLGDPLGRGWDLLGPAGQGLDSPPLGAAGLVAAQMTAVAVGFGWGAVVAARGTPRPARVAVAVVLPYLAGLCVVVLSQH